MGMLQQIAEADHFNHTDSIHKGTLVASRDIVFHATSMVIKLLIAIEGRTEKHTMILMLTSLVT